MESSVYDQFAELERRHFWFRGRRSIFFDLLAREPWQLDQCRGAVRAVDVPGVTCSGHRVVGLHAVDAEGDAFGAHLDEFHGPEPGAVDLDGEAIASEAVSNFKLDLPGPEGDPLGL